MEPTRSPIDTVSLIDQQINDQVEESKKLIGQGKIREASEILAKNAKELMRELGKVNPDLEKQVDGLIGEVDKLKNLSDDKLEVAVKKVQSSWDAIHKVVEKGDAPIQVKSLPFVDYFENQLEKFNDEFMTEDYTAQNREKQMAIVADILKKLPQFEKDPKFERPYQALLAELQLTRVDVFDETLDAYKESAASATSDQLNKIADFLAYLVADLRSEKSRVKLEGNTIPDVIKYLDKNLNQLVELGDKEGVSASESKVRVKEQINIIKQILMEMPNLRKTKFQQAQAAVRKEFGIDFEQVFNRTIEDYQINIRSGAETGEDVGRIGLFIEFLNAVKEELEEMQSK